jgi:hypothetical protein
MRPKIFEMLFNDDRMFVLELSPVTTRPLTSDEPVRNEWGVITRRNVVGYPPFRSDTFPTREEAIAFYKKTVVSTPRVSLGNKSPTSEPTVDEYTEWLVAEGLYDQVLNAGAPRKPGT